MRGFVSNVHSLVVSARSARFMQVRHVPARQVVYLFGLGGEVEGLGECCLVEKAYESESMLSSLTCFCAAIAKSFVGEWLKATPFQPT